MLRCGHGSILSLTSITSAMSAAFFPGVLRNTSMGLMPRSRKSGELQLPNPEP